MIEAISLAGITGALAFSASLVFGGILFDPSARFVHKIAVMALAIGGMSTMAFSMLAVTIIGGVAG